MEGSHHTGIAHLLREALEHVPQVPPWYCSLDIKDQQGVGYAAPAYSCGSQGAWAASERACPFLPGFLGRLWTFLDFSFNIHQPMYSAQKAWHRQTLDKWAQLMLTTSADKGHVAGSLRTG